MSGLNKLEIITDFLTVLNKRCKRFNQAGCACLDNCGMAKFCHYHWYDLSEEDIEKLYDIYIKDDSDYAEELELARKIKSSGIKFVDIEQAIEMIKKSKT